MAKISILAGTTSKLLGIFIQDSSSTVGAGLGSIAFNTSGLTAYYYREGAGSSTSISLATMTLGTWATGGFIVVDGTNMLGVYQLGIPNAAIAAGAKSVIVYLKGVTNMAPLVLEIELTAVDNQDATAFGLSRIDAAVTSRMATYTQPTGFLAATFPSGTVANTTNITAGTITTVTNLTNAATAGDLTATMKTSVTTACTASTPTAAAVTGAVGSVTAVSAGAITNTSFAAAAIDAAAIAANAIGSSEFAQTARDAVSDALLARNVAGGSSSGRIVSDAMALLRNKVDIAAGTMTVYATDDSSTLWTASVSTTAGNPISTIDPS